MAAIVTEGFKMAVRRKRKISDFLKGFGSGGLMGYRATQRNPQTGSTDSTVPGGSLPTTGGQVDGEVFPDELLRLLKKNSPNIDLSKLLKL
jgi:hypothetical protein